MFATAYDLLVSNYPDKPILIAEYGTTEPSDIPSIEWEQYGDNSDRHEYRDRWFKNALLVIEEEFPAIRGLGLFNLDKELSWSLTKSTSTGIEAFNSGIESPHYTDEFLGARLIAIGAAIDADTLWRLENEFEQTYDAALDGSFLPRIDDSENNQDSDQEPGPIRYYSTDRLRTNVVVRNVINITAHRQSIEVQSPDKQILEKARETVRQYKTRFKQISKSRGQFNKQRLNLIDY